MTDFKQVKEKANEIRINSLKMVHAANSGHPGGSLSIADILASLYFGGHLKHNPKDPEDPNRDILVQSKGHASPALYSCLGLAGFFPIEDTMSFRQLGSRFQGHIDRMRVPGVEISTGSLGHGLSNSVGIALAAKLDNHPRKIFTILSDGELQEGSNWEAAMSAAQFKLSNLIAFVDRNRIQLDGWTEETMGLNPLPDKFKAFNWEVIEINGHNLEEIDQALTKAAALGTGEKPIMIIANTIKGKGVSFMEDQVAWHGVAPKDADLANALKELV
ncbi:MAG: transketolase [Candidatus Melainabacteria bacterium]|jgi:transketolase|nr:transketolase [Candidatus Melainabacteria bacterium]